LVVGFPRGVDLIDVRFRPLLDRDNDRQDCLHRFGGPDVLELAELDVPEPLTGQVRIQVQAAAVNPVDVATRAGSLADHGLMRANGQIGIGWDLAGVIDEIGPDVDRFGAADPVIAMRDLLTASIGAQADDESLVRTLGADTFVPRTDDLGAVVRRVAPGGVHGALDAAIVGISALDGVRDGGTFVAVAAGAAPPPLRGTCVHNVWIRTDARRLT
jgi:NADPH:quinone reductase